MYYLWGRPSFPEKDCRTGNGGQRQQPVEDDTGVAGVVGYQRFAGAAGGHAGFGGPHRIERGLSENKDVVDYRAAGRFGPADLLIALFGEGFLVAYRVKRADLLNVVVRQRRCLLYTSPSPRDCS